MNKKENLIFKVKEENPVMITQNEILI